VRSKSASGRLALGNGKGCQSRNLYKWYGYVFSKESSPVKKPVSTCPRSSQVVNGSHIGKYNNYYQFIMKAEGMKNRGVRIMHAQQTLSPVSYTRGFSMENLQLDSKHLVAMNSLSSSMIPSSSRLVINLGCSTLFPVVEPGPTLFAISLASPVCSKLPPPPCASVGYTVHRIHTGHTMVTSQSIRKGTQSSIIARSKPQNDWESFSPAAGIPKDVKGVIPLPAEKTRSNHTEPEAEGFAQEGKM
jgi:hypothetical protein